VRGAEEAIAALGDTLVEARLPRPGTPRAEGYEGEGWALVRHATTEGARQALKTLISGIRVIAG
jgi:hypothetical protein